MQTTFQKIKEIVSNPEVRLRALFDSRVRFAVQVELAGMIVLFIGIFSNSGVLYLLGTGGFWYGFGSYVKNTLRVYDEWKAEKEKEEKSSNSNSNSDENGAEKGQET